MSNEQIVIDKLFEKYSTDGYITEDDIMDMCTEYDLPFHKIDYVCDKVISMGALVTDSKNITPYLEIPKEEELADYSQIDYDALYRKCTYICPEMATIVEHIKCMQPLQKGEVKQLFIQTRSGNRFAREQLINRHLRAALRITLQYENKTNIPLEDLFSVATLGLIKAVDDYDMSVHGYFLSYASLWIRQYIDRYILDTESMIRIPVYLAREIEAVEVISFDEITEDEKEIQNNFDEYEEMINKVDLHILREKLQEVLETLLEREEKILRLRYGFDSGSEMTLEEIGVVFNRTRERMRQIECKALRKLRHPSRSKKIKDFL